MMAHESNENASLLQNQDEVNQNDASHELDLNQILDRVGMGRFQWILLVSCGLGYALGTMEVVFVSFLMPEWSREFQDKSQLEISWLSSVAFLGALCGSWGWSWLMDHWGRLPVFRWTALCAGVLGALPALAWNFESLLILRFLMGIAIGGNLSIDVVFFMEFMPCRGRGFYSSIIILFGIAGVISTSLLGWWLIPTYGWRTFILACTLPNLLLWASRLFWKHETPRFLNHHKKYDDLVLVLADMACTNRQTAMLNCIANYRNGTRDNSDSDNKPPINQKIEFPIYWRMAYIALVWFCISFGYYGVTIWLSKFLENQPDLILLKSLYANFLFMGIAEIPGLFLCIMLLDRIGRRFTLLVNLLGGAVSTLLFSVVIRQGGAATWVYVPTSLIYFFIVGCWTTVYIYTPELFPISFRASASALAGMGATIGGMLAGPVGGLLLDHNVEAVWILMIFSFMFLFAALLVLVNRHETKSRHMDDEDLDAN